MRYWNYPNLEIHIIFTSMDNNFYHSKTNGEVQSDYKFVIRLILELVTYNYYHIFFNIFTFPLISLIYDGIIQTKCGIRISNHIIWHVTDHKVQYQNI